MPPHHSAANPTFGSAGKRVVTVKGHTPESTREEKVKGLLPVKSVTGRVEAGVDEGGG